MRTAVCRSQGSRLKVLLINYHSKHDAQKGASNMLLIKVIPEELAIQWEFPFWRSGVQHMSKEENQGLEVFNRFEKRKDDRWRAIRNGPFFMAVIFGSSHISSQSEYHPPPSLPRSMFCQRLVSLVDVRT
jgi:hypothetical protein